MKRSVLAAAVFGAIFLFQNAPRSHAAPAMGRGAEEFEVELFDVAINGKRLEDIETRSYTFTPADLTEGEMVITGKIKSNLPVEAVEVSLDGGANWNRAEPGPPWSYRFRPRESEAYTPIIRVKARTGAEEEFRTYINVLYSTAPPPEEDPWQVLQEMARAYENKDYSGFMSRVSDNFPNRGELEEFIRRDFRDFDGVKLNLFLKRVADLPTGKSVQADWEMQFFPISAQRQVILRGNDLDFVFADENGRLKLEKMRGENPLFGARSPDVAVSSGAPSAVYEVLRKIEDEGTRVAQAAALGVVAAETKTENASIPVTFELVDAFAHYTDGALEEVDFNAIVSGRPTRGEARVRVSDNPKNIDFTGIRLEVRDSFSGESLTFVGDVRANQEVVFRTDEEIVFAAGQTGTLTFVLDPDDQFIAIDREAKTQRESYSAI